MLIAGHENWATSNNNLAQHITLLSRFEGKDSNFEGMQSIIACTVRSIHSLNHRIMCQLWTASSVKSSTDRIFCWNSDASRVITAPRSARNLGWNPPPPRRRQPLRCFYISSLPLQWWPPGWINHQRQPEGRSDQQQSWLILPSTPSVSSRHLPDSSPPDLGSCWCAAGIPGPPQCWGCIQIKNRLLPSKFACNRL